MQQVHKSLLMSNGPSSATADRRFWAGRSIGRCG
jgi:hypothetical protein